MRWGFCLAGFFLIFNVFAQNDTVMLKLKVVDSYSTRELLGVNVINPKSNTTQATDAYGACNLRILKNDTLFLFYPGYHTVKFSVADSARKAEYRLNIALEPLTAGLNQPVIIKAPKTLEDIEEERKKLGITPKELQRPEISFTSPISALYEMLSGRAREREKLKEQMVADERRKIFRELLDYYNENGLIDLDEKYYEGFTDYCDLPVDYLKYNSDYEITKTIVALYNKYIRVTGIIK